MSKLITRIKRLALALCFVTPLVSWANTDLQVTITDNTVVIDNDNAETFDHMSFTVSSPVVTIPASETLPLGTQIELTSISFGKRASGSGNTRPNTLSITGTDGTVYTSEAIVESGTFTKAGCTKEVYSFSGKGCVLTVGLSYAMSFKNSDGSDFGTLVSRTAKDSASLFGTTVYNSSYTAWLPVQELTGEIVGSTSFTLLTGALTDIKNTDTTKPAYLHNATGWISTSSESSGELKLVNGPAGYALSVNNGNSLADNNKNRVSVWKKLSGDGLLTTGHNSGQSPAIKIYDASEFTGSINASADNVYLSVIFCSESDTFSPSVYDEIGGAGKFYGRIYIKSGTSVTVAEGATWTAVNGIVNKGALTVNGTVASAISNNGGTVTLNAGASVPSFGSQRDFTGFTVDSSVPVKITMTSEEYGKGSVSVTGADGISTITVLAPDGTTTVGTITPAESSTLSTGVQTSGLATWCDYEFNGDKSNSGVNKTGLTSDVNTTTYPEIFNSQMLYTYTHPYRGITYPDSWTAVVRCTVPGLTNAVVVTFGTYSAGAIGLIAGSNPEEEMLLVSTPGAVEQAEDKHFTTLATMKVKDATTAQHVYVFTKDGTTVNVYCDGEKVLENYELASATLGGGLQIGSLHGGVVQGEVHTGLVRFGAGEDQISSLTVAQQQNARIDCMRMYDYIVSPEQIAALSVEFPAVKLYRATVAKDADTSWTDLTWAPAWDGGNTQSKVILTTGGDATVALPASITVDEVQLDLAEGSTLTLAGPGSLAITQPVTIEDGTLELTGTVTLTQDTTFNGKVSFAQFTKDGDGAIQLSNGATVGVDAALVVTALGTYTCADGTVADAAYTGAGVKLMPSTDAVVSIKQGTTTLYYSDLDTALGPLVNTPTQFAEDTEVTLLNGTVLPFGYDGFLKQAGYYIDGDVITKAVAQIGTPTYPTLAAAVAAAADGATVKLLRASSEEITLNDKAITLDETANFSGTLTGNGTLTFKTFRNNPTITFTDWTGTVVLPSFTAGGTIFNKYGVTDSKVVLKGIDSGWLGETGTQRMDVEPTLQLDGNVTITGFSTSWDYTFAEITGTGTFSLDPTDNNPKSVAITKVAEDFSGIITNNTDKVLTIGTLERADGTSTTAGTRLLATGGNVVASALKIGGEASTIVPMTKNKGGEDDGIYVPVTINVPEVANTTVAVTGDATGDQPGNYEVVPGDTITVTYTVVDGYEHTSGELVYVIDSASTESVIVPDIVTTPYVASITSGEEVTKCTSLAGAFADAIDGDTVTLLADVAENVTIASGKTVTLDLGGKTLTATGDAITNNGTLTLQNGAITATGAIVRNLGSNSAVTVESGTYTSTGSNGIICGSSDKTVAAPTATGCSVTVNGGTFNVVEMALATGRTAGATITVNGGTFTSSDNALIGDNGTAGCSGNVIIVNGGTFNGSITTAGYIACGIYVANNDTVSVNGGTFTITGGCGIAVRAGVVTVADGVTIAATGTATGWVGDKKTKLPCAAVIYDVNPGAYPGYDSATSKVAITGGTLTSDVAAVQMFGDGLVTTTDNTLTVAEGYKWAETATVGVYQLVVQSQGIDPTDPTSKQEVTVEPTGDDEADKATAEAQGTVQLLITDTTAIAAMEAIAAATELADAQAVYNSYFKYTAAKGATEGAWEVTAEIAPAVEAEVNDSAIDELEGTGFKSADEGDEVEIALTVKPGLYYGVVCDTDLSALGSAPVALELATSTGKTFQVTKPVGSGTACFIKVVVSATAD